MHKLCICRFENLKSPLTLKEAQHLIDGQLSIVLATMEPDHGAGPGPPPAPDPTTAQGGNARPNRVSMDGIVANVQSQATVAKEVK